MSITLTLYTITCVLGISLGQLLFKKAAEHADFSLSILSLVTNGWLLTALILYGITALGWVWVLRHAPLHIAYPFMGLAFIIVPLLAWAFLGEPLGWQTLLGGALILVGVSLASGVGSG